MSSSRKESQQQRVPETSVPPARNSTSATTAVSLSSEQESSIDLDNRILSVLDEPDLGTTKLGDRAAQKGDHVEASSDDSEEELEEGVPAIMGYVPLPQNSDEDEDGDDGKENFLDECSHQDGVEEKTNITGATDMQINCLGQEIPEAKSTAEEVKLETKAVEEIKQAMSGFSLPSSSIPQWAKQVPEDVWKNELIKGLQERKQK